MEHLKMKQTCVPREEVLEKMAIEKGILEMKNPTIDGIMDRVTTIVTTILDREIPPYNVELNYKENIDIILLTIKPMWQSRLV